jgi:uncharacterized protein (UPF0216 family)
LHELGIGITLHCFKYGREEQIELKKICEKVYYYQRNAGIKYHISSKPYIVATRSNRKLLKNLLKNTNPILFEGLHSTYYINHSELKDRKKIVRAHNIEHEYYTNLASIEASYYKKIFFKREAKKLKRYEKVLDIADHILAISKNDTIYFEKLYSKTLNISAFHPNNEIQIQEGTGKYALYHGNLSVPENIYAAEFLVNSVFSDFDYPLIIAGKNPSSYLKESIARYNNIELRTNLSDNEIKELIQNAQINILPTFQKTGLKLKLLSSLYLGRHCIVNENMVENTGLEDLCIIKNTATEMKEAILSFKENPFNENDILKRKEILDTGYSNKGNANLIIKNCLS